ncbi:MAG TPA: sigma-54 dependent transcriptional regulator, partial [Syntrophomonas sp.]|nr:sigma-54 dependent transcriptional regulator [Syntrophomonas sp.]
DDKNSRKAVAKFLRQIGHNTTECDSAKHALIEFAAHDYPMVLSDIKMPEVSGLELLKTLSALPAQPKSDVVLFTGYADTESAVEALRAGAYDYLLKPVNAEELASVVEKVAQHQSYLRSRPIDQAVSPSPEESDPGGMSGDMGVFQFADTSIGVFSAASRRIVNMALKYHTDRSLSILVEGPTGTGKEIIAKLVHFGGKPEEAGEAGPFVDINCATLSHNLFESELFGYEPNAFTGSSKYGQKGKLDAANGGTLFLDELEALPLDLQGKLLRVVQEKEYYRVGGLKKIKTDVRIIGATNMELAQQVQDGSFRSDLYYRLKVGHIVLSPLCERSEEIIPLALMFLKNFSAQKRKHFKYINDDAADMLLHYPWQGNIRELRNLMEWAVFMYDDVELKPEHLASILQGPDIVNTEPGTAITNTFQLDLASDGISMKKFKELLIRKVMEINHGNKSATARYLGISRRSLINYLHQMDEQ